MPVVVFLLFLFALITFVIVSIFLRSFMKIYRILLVLNSFLLSKESLRYRYLNLEQTVKVVCGTIYSQSSLSDMNVRPVIVKETTSL